MRNKQKRQQSQIELMSDEIRDAEDMVIRQAQKEAFSAEYEALSNGRPIPKKSQISKLSPRIDQQESFVAIAVFTTQNTYLLMQNVLSFCLADIGLLS